MKILLGCLNVNGLGGSELYHYELVRELFNKGIDITLFTLRPEDPNDQVRIKLNGLGIKQIDPSTFLDQEFDIIVASQPAVNDYLLQKYPNTPIISIIHSEIRSEDPILDPRIQHYIAIRQPIADMLINDYNIPSDKVSLIYNPIDIDRFNNKGANKFEKTTGIFVGEILDPIRFMAINHLVTQCIDNDWDLYIMSESRHTFNHPNIKYLDKRWDTEEIVKNMDFTAGILLGRTTLEGLCCNIPGYVYLIDKSGNVTDIELINSKEIPELCDSKYVATQHLILYDKILNR